MPAEIETKLDEWIATNPLRLARLRLNLTRYEAASLAGIGPSTLNQWENSSVMPRDQEFMDKITRVLHPDDPAMLADAWRTWASEAPSQQ
jgi:transcriptional regulator with XRE-family HTH domain